MYNLKHKLCFSSDLVRIAIGVAAFFYFCLLHHCRSSGKHLYKSAYQCAIYCKHNLFFVFALLVSHTHMFVFA